MGAGRGTTAWVGGFAAVLVMTTSGAWADVDPVEYTEDKILDRYGDALEWLQEKYQDLVEADEADNPSREVNTLYAGYGGVVCAQEERACESEAELIVDEAA